MSGETEDAVSGWTVDTLKAHIESRIQGNDLRYQQRFESQETNLGTAITAQEKAVAAALGAAERAVAKAESATEKRFESVNEFRARLADQTRQFIPRAEAELHFNALGARLATLEKQGDDGASRSGAFKDGWGYLVGAIGTFALIAGVVIALVHR